MTPSNKLGVLLRPPARLRRLDADHDRGGCRPRGDRLGGERQRHAPEAASGAQGTAGGASDTPTRGSASSRRRGRCRRPAGCCSKPAISHLYQPWGWMEQPGAIEHEPGAGTGGAEAASCRRHTTGACRPTSPTALSTELQQHAEPDDWKADVSYVTGAHNMKSVHQATTNRTDNEPLQPDDRAELPFLNGVPNQFTLRPRRRS